MENDYQTNFIGMMEDNGWKSQSNDVYSPKGISPAITTTIPWQILITNNKENKNEK